MAGVKLRSFVVVCVAGFTVMLMATQVVGQVAATNDHSALMERKLRSAQAVLAGIARSDFDEISRESKRLRLLSHEAAWNVLQTDEYVRLSRTFRSTTTQLERAAESENLDAVGLAYVKLTISCIDCHRHTAKVQESTKGSP